MTGLHSKPDIEPKSLFGIKVLETVVHSWQLTGFFRPNPVIRHLL